MDYLNTAVNTMDALIDALMTYTKFDAEVEIQEVSLEASVAVAASQIEEDVKAKGANVVVEALPTIKGHEPQIIQLFQNLIANALKYNESDPPMITISAYSEADMCRVVIQDNGIGVPEKHLKTIFEPFKRLHGKDSHYVGSGLGLATCKKIVERHGGTIVCESEKGKGTKFIMTFPSYSGSTVVLGT